MSAANRTAIVIVAALAAPAAADEWRGGATLQYDASYVHHLAGAGGDATAEPPPVDGLGLAGLRLRGFASKTAIGYLVGVDLYAGSTNPAGFAYRADLYPIGAGMRLGAFGLAGIGGGIGASGAIGTLDDGVELPVEAFVDLGLGGRVRVLARARAVWLPATPTREDGAVTVGFADELDATVALRWGRRYHDFGFPSGNGYFVGVAYREAHGARFVGAVLGYSVDVGSR